MKRIIKYLILPLILITTGCLNTENMEDITIYTTSYPIEYITTELYGNHSTIKSIYPSGADIKTYEITKTLIDEYSDNDLYIFNSLTSEKSYVKDMRKNNKNLKIIDVTSDISYDYSVEELWLDPANLLSLANNIRKGFNEYIKNNPVLTNEIDKNYNKLKVTLTDLESKYREELTDMPNKTIVVSDDMFMFLEKYGLKVISLDKENEKYKENKKELWTLIENGSLNCIFIPDTENISQEIENINIDKVKLYTISNLTDEQRENYNYVSLSNENLEIIKKQLTK